MDCPIAPAERRLRDAFHHWRQLEQDYFDPDRFRIALNSFLQETRNVTFILQKNKAKMVGFDAWYGPWQDKMKLDPLLRWAVESRNRVTKQGDLKTESQCLVRLTSDWTDELTYEFKANPIAPMSMIVAHVLKQVPKIWLSEESLICVERRWVDSNLPGTEILQAASHILLSLSDLVRDAHEQIISNACPELRCELSPKLSQFRDTYPFELANVDETRKVWVQATNLEKIKFDVTASVLSRKDIKTFADEAHDRYGFIEPKSGIEDGQTSLTATIALFCQGARKMLEQDGHLHTFVHAMDANSHKIFQFALSMRSRVDKHLAIRRTASILEKCEIAWALLVGEAWVATYDPHQSMRHAVDHPVRQEAITLNGVSAAGQFKNKHIIFTRKDGKIVFGDELEDDSPVNIMLPILAAIRREAPSS